MDCRLLHPIAFAMRMRMHTSCLKQGFIEKLIYTLFVWVFWCVEHRIIEYPKYLLKKEKQPKTDKSKQKPTKQKNDNRETDVHLYYVHNKAYTIH